MAYNMYTNGLGSNIHPNTRLKVYSDDSKMYAVVDQANQSEDLQNSIDTWAKNVKDLDMRLSIEKCSVLHLGKNNPRKSYSINGISLKVTSSMRDLGVIMSDDLRFNRHIDDVLKRASTKSCLILRCFQIKEIDPYIKLFESLVIPTIMYASEIWNPQFTKDLKRIQRIIDKFYERIEYRCSLEKRSIKRPSVKQLLSDKDTKMLKNLVNNGRLDRIFEVRNSKYDLKSRIYPKTLARSWKMGAQVLSFYAWRVASTVNYTLA
jgi:hypothetical protein